MGKRVPVIIISGASSGIGNSCAAFLAKKKYRVYGAVRDPETYVRKADEFFELVKMDVADDDSVSGAIASVIEKEGRIDVIVACAGICLAGSAEDSSIDDFKRQFDTDFLGTVRLVKAVLPVMRKQGFGRVIGCGALESRYGIPFHSAFAAAKAATESFLLSLRLEMKPFGIDACAISPIDIRTGFTSSRKTVDNWTSLSAYAEIAKRALEKKMVDERRGTDPILVARLVRRLVDARSIHARYIIGNQSHRFPLGRMWPTYLGMNEYLACRYYGLVGEKRKRSQHEGRNERIR
jgi:NAD(P)-dependent dehydrogenase (short-subunit alcohol dehydrogenase family)